MPVLTRPFTAPVPEQVEGESSGWEAFSAAAEEAFVTGPTGAFDISLRLQRAQNPGEWGWQDVVSPAAQLNPRWRLDGPVTRKLSPEEAKQRVKDAGLEGQIPLNQYPQIREATLNMLIDLNQQKQRRQTLSEQYDGWVPGVAGMVIGSLVDPVNIASAFVPVVGEARYAQLLKRATGPLGRLGTRVRVGAAEGAVGSLMLEPLIYAGQQQWRNDYDAYDSMLNIAGGAGFGALLHAGAGLVKDRFGRAIEPPVQPRPELQPGRVETPGLGTSEPTARGAATSYDPALLAAQRERQIVLDRLAEGRPLTREQALGRAREGLRTEIEADLLARASGVADPGVVAAAKTELTAVTRELTGLESERRQLIKDINNRPGVTRKQAESLADQQLAERRADLESRKTRAETQIAGNKTAAEAVAELSAFQRGEVPEAWRAQVEAEADRLLGSDGQQPLSAAVRSAIEQDPFGGVRPFIAQLTPETQAAAFRQALAQAATDRPIDITPALLADGDYQAAIALAKDNATQVDGASPEAAAQAQARLEQPMPKTELEAAKQLLADDKARLAERGRTFEPEESALKIERDAVKAATMCLMRTA